MSSSEASSAKSPKSKLYGALDKDLRQIESTARLENENTTTWHLQVTKNAEINKKKKVCNMARTENLALVTESINCMVCSFFQVLCLL